MDMVGGWAYPPEKYESQLGWLFQIYETIKNVPNHQPLQVAAKHGWLGKKMKQGWPKKNGGAAELRSNSEWLMDREFGYPKEKQWFLISENEWIISLRKQLLSFERVFGTAYLGLLGKEVLVSETLTTGPSKNRKIGPIPAPWPQVEHLSPVSSQNAA